jgi:hypothetical protein
MRANIYIDGFNLYYRALKGTAYKWLDLEALSRKLVPDHEINRIRYFTAKVAARSGNPDSPMRQETYLRALGTNPKIDVHLGRFQETRARMALADPLPQGPRTVEVLKTEEKGTDVNMATYLLLDAFRADCDLSVVISNDADLVEPIRILITEFEADVGLVNPGSPRSRCKELVRLRPAFYKQIQERALARCQLPKELCDAVGTIRRPHRWRSKSNDPVPRDRVGGPLIETSGAV